MDSLITNVGLLCRHLTTLGCTILLTNIPSTTTFSSSSSGGSLGGNVKASQEGSLSFPHGSNSYPGLPALFILEVLTLPLTYLPSSLSYLPYLIHLSPPLGAMSASLSDLFDAILTVTTTPIIASSDPSAASNNSMIGLARTTTTSNNNNDTMLRVEVPLLLPPMCCYCYCHYYYSTVTCFCPS